MKAIISFFLLLNSLILIAQDIDVSSNVMSKQVPLAAGNYTFKMTNIDTNSTYAIEVEKKDLDINQLVTPAGFAALALAAPITDYTIGSFPLSKGEEIKITIKATDTAGSIKTYIYVYQTEKRGEWRSTFGFNFVYLTNNNTYFSDPNGDNTFTINESNNKENFVYYPTLMFSWVSNNHIDKWKNWKAGFSGGIGYDFKTSLSVFAGGSLIYNENITITAGLTFHNQKRLSSNYSENDIINENLTFDQLHTDYIRVNPFVSISFRLDRNPFETSN